MGYEEERRKRALEIYKKMGWGENEGVREADEELWKIITDVMFGEIWSRPGLSLRDRELIQKVGGTSYLAQLTEAVRGARSEAQSAFGSGERV